MSTDTDLEQGDPAEASVALEPIANRPAGRVAGLKGPRRRLGKLARSAVALGAVAVGALAIGTLAIGTLAIGRLVVGRARIRTLRIDRLIIGRLEGAD